MKPQLRQAPILVAAAALLVLIFAAPAAQARDFVPRQVVVKFKGGEDRTITLPRATSVGEALRALRRNPAVRYAAPNHIASSSLYLPGDSGRLRRPDRAADTSPISTSGTGPGYGAVGGWTELQWNFLPWQTDDENQQTSPGGIDAIGAWRNLRRVGRPGGRGVVVAVIDTGVAYRSYGKRFRRNPDFHPRQFVPGYDFVRDNQLPLDRNGHGTHVAGTIAQSTDNGIGLTGIAYGARIMPIRVLDARGNGSSDRIADGIRWAADHGADVINMSFNFACGDTVPNVATAVRYAHRQGAVTVASVGNAQTEQCVSAPATYPQVIGVGGITEGGCLGDYSLAGPGLDLVAPGGGSPLPGTDCEAEGTRPIFQLTYVGAERRRFGFPLRYFGTSMAAAHVSGTAALVIAAGTAGARPTPTTVRQRLLSTTRRPQVPVRHAGYGAGVLDAAAATDRRVARRSRR